jgi:hypothetical protein
MTGHRKLSSTDRLHRLERQASARREALEVVRGVEESVALRRGRGEALIGPSHHTRGPRATPYRRQPGLDWLAAKGRIDSRTKAAGERYGAAFRRARYAESTLPSSLKPHIRTGRFTGPDPAEVMARGEVTAAAARRLAEYRRRLSGQADLIAACDLVCGEEKTPREAAGPDRDAIRLEAVLKVALDILAAEV